jgi:hypothetical protein
MVTDDSETFRLDNVQSAVAGTACGDPHRGGKSKNTYERLLIYLLTPCSTALLEWLTGLQLIKKFPAFYGTRRFITTFTIARHLPLS